MPSGYPSSRLPPIKSKTKAVVEDDGENVNETSSEPDTISDEEKRLESCPSNSSNGSGKDSSTIPICIESYSESNVGTASTGSNSSYLKQPDIMDSPRKRKRISNTASTVEEFGDEQIQTQEESLSPSSSSRLNATSPAQNHSTNSGSLSIPSGRRHSFMGKISSSTGSAAVRSDRRASIFSIFQKKEHNTIGGDSTTIEIDRAFEAWVAGEELNKETKQAKKDKKALGSMRRRLISPSDQNTPTSKSKPSRRNSSYLSEVSSATSQQEGVTSSTISATSSPGTPPSASPANSRQGSVIRKQANEDSKSQDLYKQNIELKVELEKARQEIAQWEKKYNELLQINGVLQSKLAQYEQVDSKDSSLDPEKGKEPLRESQEVIKREVETESIQTEEAEKLNDKGKEEITSNEIEKTETNDIKESKEIQDLNQESKQSKEEEADKQGENEVTQQKEEEKSIRAEEHKLPVINALFGLATKQFGLPPKRVNPSEQPRDINYLKSLHERLLRKKEVEQFYQEPSLPITIAQSLKSLEKTSSLIWMSFFEDSLLKLKHKVHVAMEILKTERTYVGHINILLHVFLHPLKQAVENGQPIISKDEIKNIFYQLEVIYGYNSALLHSLEERINGWINDGEMERPLLLGDLFLEMAAFLQTYSSYINNYTTALQTLSVCSKNQLFIKFLQSENVIQALGHKMDCFMLKDYLILPIQRIPRYIMLLENLLKHTEREHPDFKNITKALKKVQVVADQNHKTQLDIENTSKVFSIQKLLNYRLVETNRRWIKDGEIFVFEFKTSQVKFLQVYLFNDIIVMAKKSGNQLKHLKTVPVVLMRVEEGCFDKPFKDKERENQTKVLTKAGASTTHGFRIISSAGTFLLCPKTAEMKKSWIQAINSAIESVSVVVKPFEKRASVTLMKTSESDPNVGNADESN